VTADRCVPPLRTPSNSDVAPRVPHQHQPLHICTPRGRGLLPNSPILNKIPAASAARLPSNIPLRTLPARDDRQHEQSSRLLTPHGHGHPVDEPGSSESEEDGSDESPWTDTGDIAEQLADEDPLRQRLDSAALDDDILAGVFNKRRPKHHNRQSKRVRYREPLSSGSSPSTSRHASAAISKEAIRIPTVARRTTSRAERLLAAIMTGGTSSIHGLTGKPLLLVSHGILFDRAYSLTKATVTLLRFLYH
jgi:hypothetical protein